MTAIKLSVLTVLLSLMLFVPSSHAAMMDYKVDVLGNDQADIRIIRPQDMVPGSTALVLIQSQKSMNWQALLNGQEIPIMPWNDKLFCLPAIDVRSKALTHHLELKYLDKRGTWQTVFQYSFKAVSIKPRQIRIIAKGAIAKKDFNKKRQAENQLLATAYQKGKEQQLFSESFANPLKEARINTECGAIRNYANIGLVSVHGGTDFKAPKNTEVFSLNQGTVVFCGFLSLEGNAVIINHGADIFSLYAHLEKISVKEGEQVKKTQLIGYSGKSGNAYGAHLHLGLKVNKKTVDPIQFMELINHCLFITAL